MQLPPGTKPNWWTSVLLFGFHIFDLIAYEVLYGFSPVRNQLFFNGGYLPLVDDFLENALWENEKPNAMMYHLVCKPIESQLAPAPKKFLVVGCGQGGGMIYMAHFFSDAEFIGTERARAAVKLVNRRSSDFPNISARVATGDRLDFDDEEFDALVSVGAPTYFGLTRFVEEAMRVCKPGATISFSGGYREGTHDIIESELSAACNGKGHLVSYANITPNTFASLKADLPRREKILKNVPWPFRIYGEKWADMPGSAEYNEYDKGLRADFFAVIKKSA